MQKFAVNLLAGDYPDHLIPLLIALIGAVVVVAVIFTITIVRSKHKKKDDVEVLPVEYEGGAPELPKPVEPSSELPKDEFEETEDENEAIADELDDIEQELADIEDELDDIEADESEEQIVEVEQTAETIEQSEEPEEIALALAEEQHVEEVAEEVAEEQPVEEVVEEVAEEQPVEEVTEEVAEEQPVEEVTEEVAEEQPVEEVTEEVAEERPVEEVAEQVVEEQPVVIPEKEENVVVRSVNTATGLAVIVRYKKSYKAKYIQSKDESKSYYTMLKNALLSYKKVKSRISWGHENFNAGRANIARFTMRGKSLCVYFALNPDDYAGTKYRVERSLSKKYEGVPCLYRIKNGRRAKYALDLIAALMEKYGLAKGDEQHEDYYLPYETTEQLVEEGLIKELIKEEDYNEFMRLRAERANSDEDEEDIDEVVEEEEEEQSEEPEIVEEVTEVVVEDVVQEGEIVEEVTQVVVENVVEEQSVEEAAEQVAEEQPEEEVVEEIAEEQPVEEVAEEVAEQVEEQPEEEIYREEVSAEEVNEIIDDEVAVALVEKKTGYMTVAGKKAIINIDILSKNFEKNEVVNLESLKAKNLVAKNVSRIKVLARGTLTKPLTVEANDFSIEAVKMIVVTGGKAVKI